MSSFVVGVDGGTTKTIALVADGRGCILGASRGPGSNWSGPNPRIPMGTVERTVRRALAEARLSVEDIALAVCCLAGADWPEDHESRRTLLQASGIARQVVVKNDAFGGLRAGTSRSYGLVIAAGTAVNAAAIAPDGREWAFGYYADRGGAKDVARQAMRAVLRAEDGRGRPTALTAAVLERLGLATPEAMLRAWVAGEIEQGRINSLCPLVFAAAEAGDEVATQIIVDEGLALAEYAIALIRRFALQNQPVDVVLAGSEFKGQGQLLARTIQQAIGQVAPHARIVRAQFEPVVGALLLAYDALGVPSGSEVYANLAASMPGPEFFNTADGGSIERRDRPRETYR